MAILHGSLCHTMFVVFGLQVYLCTRIQVAARGAQHRLLASVWGHTAQLHPQEILLERLISGEFIIVVYQIECLSFL